MANKNLNTENLSQYIRNLEAVEKARSRRILLLVGSGVFVVVIGLAAFFRNSLPAFQAEPQIIDLTETESLVDSMYLEDYSVVSISANSDVVNEDVWEEDNYNTLEDWSNTPELGNEVNSESQFRGTSRGNNKAKKSYVSSSYSSNSSASNVMLTSQMSELTSNEQKSAGEDINKRDEIRSTSLNTQSREEQESRSIDQGFAGTSDINDVYEVADKMPTFPKGAGAMYRFIRSNVEYPTKAIEEAVEGQVHVQFIILPNGSITNVHVAKSLGFGCDEEAVRIIKKMPNWVPGETRGEKVAVKKIVPVTFVLP